MHFVAASSIRDIPKANHLQEQLFNNLSFKLQTPAPADA
jgi:hypothetical protein